MRKVRKKKKNKKPKPQPTKIQHQQTIADTLGWRQWAKSALAQCSGYYSEKVIYYPFKPAANVSNSPIDIRADQTEYAQKGQTVLQGNVVVTQPERQVQADKAYLNRNPKTGKFQTIDGVGNVYLREPGRLVKGSKAHINLANKTWSIDDPIYRMVMDKNFYPDKKTGQDRYRIYGLSGWGHAQQAYKEQPGVIIIKNGTYSTCPPLKSDWKLKASKVKLNRNTGRGEAFNTLFYIKDFPIFYTPYANFPINNQRKTGFLFPSFEHSSDSGADVSIPFYWNIAPNYDATFTPHYLQKRGAKLDGIFRYMLGTPASTGQISASWLPDDREFSDFKKRSNNRYRNSSSAAIQQSLRDLDDESTSRTFFAVKNKTQFNEHFNGSLNYAHVSDDYYPQDFGNSAASSETNQLTQQAQLDFTSQHWNIGANVQGYQTLHPLNEATVSNSYSRLPEITANGNYHNLPGGLDFAVNSGYTYFTMDKNPGQATSSVTGSRFYIDPTLSLPLKWGQAAYFTPKVQLAAAAYDLNNPAQGNPSNPGYAVPIIDVDTGLYFDRDVKLPITGTKYTQTLEPRLFYLYAPDVKQNDIPVFDSGIQTFDYDQLFATNRFSGHDRIGDANQLTLALTSRLVDPYTGRDKISASIGQIFYFRNRDVSLCAAGAQCDGLDITARRTDGTSDTSVTSPIAAALSYNIYSDWYANTTGAWNPETGTLNNAYLNLQYKRDERHIVNVGYSYLRDGDIFQEPNGRTAPDGSSKNNLDQFNFAFAWPVWHNWSAVGQWNYNFSHDYVINQFLGLQYDNCCWAVRVVGSRYYSNLDERSKPEFDSSVYVQVLFKGIGAVGTGSPGQLLTSAIDGYEDPFAYTYF